MHSIVHALDVVQVDVMVGFAGRKRYRFFFDRHRLHRQCFAEMSILKVQLCNCKRPAHSNTCCVRHIFSKSASSEAVYFEQAYGHAGGGRHGSL